VIAVFFYLMHNFHSSFASAKEHTKNR